MLLEITMDGELDCNSDKLIDEACEGKEWAFRRLVECNQDKLFSAMNRFLGCREDAEEAVQEAFIRAFLRIEDFNRQSKFSTWLYRIAYNSAISDTRKRRPQISLDQRLDVFGVDLIDSEASPVDEKLIQAEKIELVHKALDQLSDEHRAILVLREMDDLAYEEISKVLNVSVGTVRSRLSRARGRLREVIDAIRSHIPD